MNATGKEGRLGWRARSWRHHLLLSRPSRAHEAAGRTARLVITDTVARAISALVEGQSPEVPAMLGEAKKS